VPWRGVAQVAITGGPDSTRQPGLFSDEVFNPTGIGMSLSHTVMVLSNELFHITLETKANIYAVGGGIAEASVDPTSRSIRVPGAARFSFAVSPELLLAPVPEPATFWLLASCLGMGAFHYRRGSRTSHVRK
jgi:hypothetical protein